VENLEALGSAEVHVLMAEGGEFPWGKSGGIVHADLDPFVKVGDHCVAVDARDGSVLDMEFHVPPN
jgi:hypothetical protein